MASEVASGKTCNFFKKETPTRVFLYILQNFKNSVFYRTFPVAASIFIN